MDFRLSGSTDGFDIVCEGRVVFRHSVACPAIDIARGDLSVEMLRGNFSISDNSAGQIAIRDWRQSDGDVQFLVEDEVAVVMTMQNGAIEFVSCLPGYDRIGVNFHAEPGEAVWGGGEQISYLDLRGRRFPIWTSEPGVGRDKTTRLTQLMDAEGGAGGDYWNTNYPQPTFLTSRWLAIHLDESCYSVLDFTDPAHHRVEVMRKSARFELFAASDPVALVSRLSDRFGRQPKLPEWSVGGAIVGLKSGQSSFDRLDAFLDAGAAVSGLWCEDWAGIRETTFGRRLFWDWVQGERSASRYPELSQGIARLKERGVRFLAYVNPYLACDGTLFDEAREGGHFCLKQDADEVYLVDFGEFECGVIDFTRPQTRDWFAERVLGQEMLDHDISGWMADFGEYLPTDVRLADGSDPMETHNLWPVLWAQVNARAIASRGLTGDTLFFMRAGFSGVQGACQLLWAGDQCVDFTRHDGIGTVITAALSSGLVGNAYSHSDCGGYTSLHGYTRSAELMMRWCELAAFAPVMRSHEGNRPDDNLQYDSTPELLSCFARWSRVHEHLAPYVNHLCDEAVKTGLPLQRPLFLHFPTDSSLFSIQDQFLYGEELLVAPIIEEGQADRQVVLPGDGFWRHCWTGVDYPAGMARIEAPIGQPPVFYRPDGQFARLFAKLEELV